MARKTGELDYEMDFDRDYADFEAYMEQHWLPADDQTEYQGAQHAESQVEIEDGLSAAPNDVLDNRFEPLVASQMPPLPTVIEGSSEATPEDALPTSTEYGEHLLFAAQALVDTCVDDLHAPNGPHTYNLPDDKTSKTQIETSALDQRLATKKRRTHEARSPVDQVPVEEGLPKKKHRRAPPKKKVTTEPHCSAQGPDAAITSSSAISIHPSGTDQNTETDRHEIREGAEEETGGQITEKVADIMKSAHQSKDAHERRAGTSKALITWCVIEIFLFALQNGDDFARACVCMLSASEAAPKVEALKATHPESNDGLRKRKEKKFAQLVPNQVQFMHFLDMYTFLRVATRAWEIAYESIGEWDEAQRLKQKNGSSLRKARQLTTRTESSEITPEEQASMDSAFNDLKTDLGPKRGRLQMVDLATAQTGSGIWMLTGTLFALLPFKGKCHGYEQAQRFALQAYNDVKNAGV
jgi:hypothetical protein